MKHPLEEGGRIAQQYDVWETEWGCRLWLLSVNYDSENIKEWNCLNAGGHGEHSMIKYIGNTTDIIKALSMLDDRSAQS